MTENFDTIWSKAKTFFYIDFENLQIIEISNNHSRELYEDVKYRNKHFFTLLEAKKSINKAKGYTPEGHILNIPKLSEFIIKKLNKLTQSI